MDCFHELRFLNRLNVLFTHEHIAIDVQHQT